MAHRSYSLFILVAIALHVTHSYTMDDKHKKTSSRIAQVKEMSDALLRPNALSVQRLVKMNAIAKRSAIKGHVPLLVRANTVMRAKQITEKQLADEFSMRQAKRAELANTYDQFLIESLSDSKFIQCPKQCDHNNPSCRLKSSLATLPTAIKKHIATFKGALLSPKIIEQNLKELIPFVVPVPTYAHQPINQIIKRAEELLQRHYGQVQEHYKAHPKHRPTVDHTCIIGVCGLWGWKHDSSFFRQKHAIPHVTGPCCDDIYEWFGKVYGINQIPLTIKDNEFLGVMWSDGSITWHISPRNMALLQTLNSNDQNDQVDLAKTLFATPQMKLWWPVVDYRDHPYTKTAQLHEKEFLAYSTLPIKIQKIVDHNYRIGKKYTYSEHIEKWKGSLSNLAIILGLPCIPSMLARDRNLYRTIAYLQAIHLITKYYQWFYQNNPSTKRDAVITAPAESEYRKLYFGLALYGMALGATVYRQLHLYIPSSQ